MTRLACKAKPIRESLDAGCFPDGQSSVLVRMDIPVGVLGHMRCDRSAKVVPFQSLVLVREDVAPVPAESIRKVNIGAAFVQERECLSVVSADLARNVVVDPAAVTCGDPPA